jgi:EAL domain-containing protein (putative c-di-GMP-specific phosphodiesterase class I)/GGDEF domain-containing protein/CheY-like chemotaxis protein
MKIKDIIRLLILNESQNEAEDIINLFRNGGYPTRAQRFNSMQELEQLIGEDQWDLLISDDSHPELKLHDALTTLTGQKADIPAILLSADTAVPMAEAIAMGVQDRIAKADTQHLLHAALREIKNRRMRLDGSAVRGTLEELQARYELLMGGSQDAIAYITDGMHVDVNDAYAAQFGFENANDMDCMPVIDLIADRDQDAFKAFLRDYAKTGESNSSLEICGLAADGGELNLHMLFSPASYEGEDCTQIVIRAGGNVSSGGKDFRQGFADLAQQVVQLRNTNTEACLAYLHIKNLSEVRTQVGILAADTVVAQLQDILGKQCPDALLVTQLSHDGYALLLGAANPEAVQKTLDQLIETTNQHIIEVGSVSTHCELLASVMVINHKAAESAETLVNQVYTGIDELLMLSGDTRSLVYTPPAAPINLGAKDIDLDELHEEGRLKLLYQPVVSLRGEPGEHYEVTATLQDNDGTSIDVNLLAAGMFDEKQGSLFDRWVIFAATKLLAKKRTPGNADTRLIINLSSASLRDSDLVNWLGVSLGAAGLPTDALAFQLDTNEAETSLKLTERFFAALNKLGCNHGLRNFDLARDSAKVLEHIAPAMIKISEEGVERAQTDEQGRHLLKQILNEVSQAGAATIVPNVCNAATLATLWQLGAAFIQGSYLQDPAPEMDYEFAEIA